MEDEPSVRAAVQQLLERLGYQTVAAASGEEAVALRRDGPFDLLLTDTMLPGITGVDVVRALRARRHDVRLRRRGRAPEGRELDAWKFLQKPVDLESRARTIRETVDAG